MATTHRGSRTSAEASLRSVECYASAASSTSFDPERLSGTSMPKSSFTFNTDRAQSARRNGPLRGRGRRIPRVWQRRKCSGRHAGGVGDPSADLHLTRTRYRLSSRIVSDLSMSLDQTQNGSLNSERDERVDRRRSPRRNPGCDHRDCGEQDRGRAEADHIMRGHAEQERLQ